MERKYLTEWKRFLSEKTDYTPFIAMNDLAVNIAMTGGAGIAGINTGQSVVGNTLSVTTKPGKYDIADDTMSISIGTQSQQKFACTGVKISGPQSNLALKQGRDWWIEPDGWCRILLSLDRIWDWAGDYVEIQEKIQLIISSNAEEDPFFIDIDLGNSRFSDTRG